MPDHRLPEVQRNRKLGDAFGPVLLVVLAPIWLPFLVIGAPFYFIYSATLYILVWFFWCKSGSRIFLVYSRSPHWQTHIENSFLPKLPPSTIVLNWSDRNTWSRWSLGIYVFHHFLGYYKHTPSIIVFRPLRRAKIFRFFEAFQEFKHGNNEPLHKLEDECLGLCNAL